MTEMKKIKADNTIKSNGAIALCEALKVNNTLTLLDLKGDKHTTHNTTIQ